MSGNGHSIASASLLDLVRREPAEPWRDGDNIPWHEPGFSERMLAEHLSQDHDAASRRLEKIDAHVDWIHEHVLGSAPGRVLDLGCGPGFYASRLAQRGHECVGIDYSPASIAHARGAVEDEQVNCRYVEADIRRADYGNGFGLVMLIYGELNVFRPDDARLIVRKAHDALDDGGCLLLEPHTEAAVRTIGGQPPSWYSAERGLFSDRPHLLLQEHSWDETARAATIRYFVVDAANGSVARHAQSFQAYSDDEYRALLTECGFVAIELHPSLGGAPDEAQEGLMAIVARLPHRGSPN